MNSRTVAVLVRATFGKSIRKGMLKRSAFNWRTQASIGYTQNVRQDECFVIQHGHRQHLFTLKQLNLCRRSSEARVLGSARQTLGRMLPESTCRAVNGSEPRIVTDREMNHNLLRKGRTFTRSRDQAIKTGAHVECRRTSLRTEFRNTGATVGQASSRFVGQSTFTSKVSDPSGSTFFGNSQIEIAIGLLAAGTMFDQPFVCSAGRARRLGQAIQPNVLCLAENIGR